VTSYTVTATNGGGGNGIALQVEMITGAVETGGASTSASNSNVLTASLTPNYSNSFIAWAAMIATSSPTSISGATSNALLTVAAGADTFNDATQGVTYSAGYYSGTVTAATPVTVGGSQTALSTYGEMAAYEIQPSGSWAENASTPAYAHSTSAAAITTASFTPAAAGGVLVAVACCNFSGVGSGSNITITSSPSLTWTQRASNAASSNGGVGVFTATVPSSFTVGPPPGLQALVQAPVTVPVISGWRNAAHSR
jgi:hypothetical protein